MQNFFNIKSIKQILANASDVLRNSCIDSTIRDSRVLLSYVLKCDMEFLITNPEYVLQDKEIQLYFELIRRRSINEPVSRIIGKREFWSLPFKVTNSTLDPRPESETIIESVILKIKDKNRKLVMLDVGTGSGCLILSLLYEYPNSIGIAIDKSYDAIKVAMYNAKKLNLFDRVAFVNGNWIDSLKGFFDLIVVNPPYIPSLGIKNLQKEVRFYDPLLALDGGEDGLSPYYALSKDIGKLLSSSGFFICEVGYNQYEKVVEIFEKENLVLENIIKDLSGVERCLIMKKYQKNIIQ